MGQIIARRPRSEYTISMYAGTPITETLLPTVLWAVFVLVALGAFGRFLELPKPLPGRTLPRARRGGLAALVGIAAAALLTCGEYVSVAGAPQLSGWEFTARTAALAVVSCLATGIFEEGLVRGLLFRLFARGFSDRKNPLLAAALVSAALFAAFHVTGDFAAVAQLSGVAQAIAVFSLAAKAVQAFAFGVLMTAAYLRWYARGAWRALAKISLLHAAYDAVAFAPLLITSGTLPSAYATTDPWQLAFMLATVAVLAFSAVFAVHPLKTA